MSQPWIGFDFDGTLVSHFGGQSLGIIGPVIPAMARRVNLALQMGYGAKIVTARVASSNPDREQQRAMIQDWLQANGLPALEVTAEKDFLMILLYDDRAVQVQTNTGMCVGFDPLQAGLT